MVDNKLIVQYVFRVGIQDRFKQTDQALEDVPTWPNVGLIIIFCHIHNIHRMQIDQSVTAQKIQPIGTIGADGAEAFKSKLKFQIQHEVFRCCNILSGNLNCSYTSPCRVKVREGKIAEITEILAWYEYINDVILDHLDENIKSTDRQTCERCLTMVGWRVKYLKKVHNSYNNSTKNWEDFQKISLGAVCYKEIRIFAN